jgi:predicted protein tyrosine phosphatase
MPRIIVCSVFDAFEYCMDHYAPFGLEEFADRKDRYAVISIQDSHTDGFGIRFCESASCSGALTLLFDDIVRPVDGAVFFSAEQADRIIDFALAHRDADTILVHCYAGESRSRAVGGFLEKLFGAEHSRYLDTGSPNEAVLRTLNERWMLRSNNI